MNYRWVNSGNNEILFKQVLDFIKRAYQKYFKIPILRHVTMEPAEDTNKMELYISLVNTSSKF